MIKKKFSYILCVVAMLSLLFAMITMTVSATETNYGSAGTIMESMRNPEAGDTSNWLTIQSGEVGIRIINNEGRELVMVDNFGGIYLNGDVYLNQKLLNTDMFQTANGFFYLLLVISIALNVWNTIRIRKINK